MDKYEHRRQRLLWLRDHECGGSSAELGRRIEREASYVTRMLYPEGKPGRKRIGEELVDLVEHKFTKPKGWMDGVETDVAPDEAVKMPVMDAVTMEVATLMAKMSMAEKNQMLWAAKMLLGPKVQQPRIKGKSDRAA